MRVMVIVFILCSLWTPAAKDICSLKIYGSLARYRKEGDLILGGVFQLFQYGYGAQRKRIPVSSICALPSARFLRHFLAVDFAITNINNNINILPNISLGYDIYDSCFYEQTAVESALKILSGGDSLYPNYDCRKKDKVMAFIGHLLSSSSQALANLLAVYGYPQVSYGSTDPIFTDRVKFPFFFRTVPNEHIKNRAIVELMKRFGWTWVGIVYSTDDSNQKASEELISLLLQSGICVAYAVKFHYEDVEACERSLSVMLNSSANVIIAYSTIENVLVTLNLKSTFLDHSQSLAKKVWILLFPPSTSHPEIIKHFAMFNGSILVSTYRGDIPNLKEFLIQANPEKYPNRLLNDLWMYIFKCKFPSPGVVALKLCRSNLTLSELPVWLYDVNSFRLTYSVYIAVYALAHALHNMYLYHFKKNMTFAQKHPGKLINFLKHVTIKFNSGDEIFFDASGEIPGTLDLLNWVIYPNGSIESIHIGQYHSQQISLNDRSEVWSLSIVKNPGSLCTERCLPGSRKSLQEGKHVCCYNCVTCSTGEISNMTDADSCTACPEDEWPNERRDKCVPRLISFLSVQEPLGITLITCTTVFVLITAIVAIVFALYRNTPIVRASNRDLSYILLISLLCSFLCPLLFIGQPTTLSCLLRQVTFCVIFTVSVSTTLAKNVAVLVAFKCTKPENKIKLWPMYLLPKAIITLCCLIQVLICTLWLIQSPPFPERDTQTEMGKIILQCNEGSIVAFYIALGYIGTLAICSFILAFLLRKLPDRFNETHHITFSMLCFCSVWVTFIPVYLRTKGKYLVAVEIFAMLSSSAGLLFCIFIPKCHTIILRPELNVSGKISFKCNKP